MYLKTAKEKERSLSMYTNSESEKTATLNGRKRKVNTNTNAEFGNLIKKIRSDDHTKTESSITAVMNQALILKAKAVATYEGIVNEAIIDDNTVEKSLGKNNSNCIKRKIYNYKLS